MGADVSCHFRSPGFVLARYSGLTQLYHANPKHTRFCVDLPPADAHALVMDDQQFLVRLGEEVRTRRRMKGWSQEDLAGETGVHVNQVSLVERGGVNASLIVTRKIAEGLGMKLSELLAGAGE